MPTYLSNANDNLTSNTSWLTAETGTASQQLTVSTNGHFTSLTYYKSAQFTVTTAKNIVAVVINGKRLNTTGTVTVGISKNNGSTYEQEVTVNASDLPASQSWIAFVFNVTGDGAATWVVAIKSSSASNAIFYRDATNYNWSRILFTADAPAGAPVAADKFFICGLLAGGDPGTLTSYTITMNSTASTAYGEVNIGYGGTLSYGTSTGTAYQLVLAGIMNVWAGGALKIGDVGSAIPSDSTAKLQFSEGTTNVLYGLIVKDGATFIAQGNPKTTVSTLLTVDRGGYCSTAGTAVTRVEGQGFTGLSGTFKINGTNYTISAVVDNDHITLTGSAGTQTKVYYIPANTTVLTVGSTSGWVANDVLGIAATGRVIAQYEKPTISTVDSGTQVTLSAGLSFNHSGMSPTQAEVINLTRNVTIFGTSASYQAYVTILDATVDLDYVEFYWLGANTTNKRGFEISTVNNTSSIQYCSFHDYGVGGSVGLFLEGVSLNNITVNANVFYNINGSVVYVYQTTSGSWTITNNVVIGTAGGDAFILSDVGGTFTGNRASGSASNGLTILEQAAFVSFDDFVGHTNATNLWLQPGPTSTLSNMSLWRGTAAAGGGIQFSSNLTVPVTLEDVTLFGNNGYNIVIFTLVSRYVAKVVLDTVVAGGDTIYSTQYGFGTFGADLYLDIQLLNCSFGETSGIRVAHTGNDIYTPANAYVQIRVYNTTLASATPVSSLATALLGSSIRCQRLGGAAGVHKSWFTTGTIERDAVIYKTAIPSEKMTPNSASLKLESAPLIVGVNNGSTATISVWVRKSQAADTNGVDYNGNHPNLIVKKNVAIGIDDDTVLDTMSVGLGEWEQLSGTTAEVTDDAAVEVVVDCDGTAGWINVDDWSVS